MSDTDSGNTGDLEALRALQADAQELERIESLHDQFNIFETIGFVSQELMHSNFLAFLLDPNQNHGLRDAFLKMILEKALATNSLATVSEAFEDVGNRNLEQTSVRTEVYTEDGRIDILLLNEVTEWAVIVENKIWSTEHSDQLDRYFRFVTSTYPEYQVQEIYLTPYEATPSHKAYLPLGYKVVCESLESILEDRGSNLRTEVRVSVEQYVQMVRRQIVGEPEAANLAQEIYQKHQQALDFIYQHRFARQQSIQNMLSRLIEEYPDLVYTKRYTDYPTQEYIHFGLRQWDVPRLQTGSSLQKSKRILLFGFGNYPEEVSLFLQIRPGDDATRQRLLDMAHANPDVFENAETSLIQWTNIFSKTLLSPRAYENATNSERKRIIYQHWTDFLDEDLPRIEEAIKAEGWIWESFDDAG